MNEDEMKEILVKKLSHDFIMLPEVEGTHLVEKTPMRIDFMMYPKQHLINRGFVDDWIGVEVKHITGKSGTTSKLTRLAWQSITYAQSEFLIDGASIRPAFVAMHINEVSVSEGYPDTHFSSLRQLALYGNVGHLYFYSHGMWAIKFSFNYAVGKEHGYVVKKNLLPKRRTGSI